MSKLLAVCQRQRRFGALNDVTTIGYNVTT